MHVLKAAYLSGTVVMCINKLYEEMEVKLDIYWGRKCHISGICNIHY